MWPPQVARLPGAKLLRMGGWVPSLEQNNRFAGCLPSLPAAPRSSRGQGGQTTFPGRVSHGCRRPGPHSWLTEEPPRPVPLPISAPSCQPYQMEPELAAKARGQRAEAGVPREGRGHLSGRGTAAENLAGRVWGGCPSPRGSEGRPTGATPCLPLSSAP